MGENILVLGLGELGTAVVNALINKRPPNTDITVLLRPSTLSTTDPTKSKQINLLKSQNIKFISGDVSNDTSTNLSTFFRPYDLIISCLGFASGPGSQLKIAEAVLSAKVKRFVPWQFGVDYDIIGRGSAQDLFDEQLDVRDVLRGQKETKWIIVSTGMFISFLFESSFGVVDLDAGVVRALGEWENRVTVTGVEDIGELTAEIVFDGGQWEKIEDGDGGNGGVVFTAGETISYARLKDVVEEVTGRKFRGEVWSVDFLKDQLRRKPEDGLRKYRVVFAEGRGVAWDFEGTFNFRRGIQVLDVRGWAVRNLGGLGK